MKFRVTMRQTLVLVACIGLGLGLLKCLMPYDYFFGFGTVYSPGYSESRFDSIRHGMTANEVETILGPPLKKMPGRWYGDADAWAYSDQPNEIAYYRRRWIILKDNLVIGAIKDLWVD